MDLERKKDLSIYYWISGLFTSYPSVKVVDGFPEEDLELPVIAVETDRIDSYPFELGNSIRNRTRFWYIDTYAITKSQRDEISYIILNACDEGKIPVYDYDIGFPPTVVPQIGALNIEDYSMEIVRVIPELTEKMYYRSVVRFTTEYTQLGG
jgi:hypothetical protein